MMHLAATQATTPAFLHTPAVTNAAQRDPRAWKVAQDFEAQILSSMMQPMFEGLQTDGAFGGGEGEGAFRSLLVEQYGKEMTNSGGIGLSDMIYGEILKLQEGR